MIGDGPICATCSDPEVVANVAGETYCLAHTSAATREAVESFVDAVSTRALLGEHVGLPTLTLHYAGSTS